MTKRLIDITVSLIALVLTAPLLLILALLIAATLGRPVLFHQDRPGLHGKIFRLNKFRSMSDDRNSNGELLPDKQRLTSVGHFLRSLSLDELPTLWNVLKGDMSIVGPRPLLPEYLSLYNSEQARRHDVKPGITGWAQINGRNAISWEEKFKLDVWYVDNQSLLLDVKIILITAWKVVHRDGISEAGEATATKFCGNNSGEQDQQPPQTNERDT